MEQMPKGPREDTPPILLRPGEGVVHAGLPTHILKANSEAARGAYSLYEETYPPGTPGPAVHIHHDQEEAFYVLEGVVTFLLGEELISAPAGTFVLVPAGWRHGFANRGSEVARALNIHSPRGFERQFERLGKWLKDGEDVATMIEVAEKDGIETVGRPLGMTDEPRDGSGD